MGSRKMVDTHDHSARHARGALLGATLGLLLIAGCSQNSGPVSVAAGATTQPTRNVVALGRVEPTSGVISISALPGEKLTMYAPGIEAGAKVPAGGELAQTATFDLRQTQLKAAELKHAASQEQRSQELLAAQVQVEQALATHAQAEAKLREMQAQEGKLKNLAEAAAIAADDYKKLVALQAEDEELVTAHQLRRRQNASDRAAKEYEAAAAAYPDGLEAARKGVAAAEAGVRLAQQSAALAEKVDQTLAADLDRQAAATALDQAVLRAPQVEGGAAEFTVLRTMVDPGELIAQTPVIEIADLTQMSCVAEVYEADAKEIRDGQRVTLRSPAFTGDFATAGIPGRVVRIGSMVASPGLTNRNPLAPSDRSIVEVDVEIDPANAAATAEAASKVGLQVTVEFLGPDEKKPPAKQPK
ncbi:HlyD family efflux transporter periplasmic adaptor subunit [Lacipirellula sp.]|uniref:HlyD family efflux transporter periplasmic adaptor subunit n=1 Tax=Lacipirellula sp. TaxID=2691419 RepID=UPI003D0A03F1